MASTRELVREALDRLSDEEAGEVLNFVREIEGRRGTSTILQRLATEPAFRLPAAEHPPFKRVEPIVAAGRAASEILTEDRR